MTFTRWRREQTVGMATGMLLVAMSLAHSDAVAQARAAARFPSPSPPLSPPPAAGTGRLVAGGVVGGLVGFFAVGLAGAAIANDPNSYEDLDALAGFVVGSTIGESLLLPVGVHLADHRRGKVLPAMLVSLGIGVAGVAAVAATMDSAPWPGIILALTPVAQLATTIAIERDTAR